MKNISILLLAILGLAFLTSCDKKDSDPANHFTYNGKDYVIDTAAMIKLTFDKGLKSEQAVYQFMFTSIVAKDTNLLFVAVFDTLSNVLSGNYPGIDQISVDKSSRGIFPFGYIVASALSLSDDQIYFTGKGGSIDISEKDGKFNISFNAISAGVYGDILDQNTDGKTLYTQVSTISGTFNGVIIKDEEVISKKSTTKNLIPNKILNLATNE